MAAIELSVQVRWLAGLGAGTVALLMVPKSALAGFLLSVPLLVATLPLMQRYAMARPNQRSGHRVPTPQGAGAAVLVAALGATAAWILAGTIPLTPWLIAIAVAALALAITGAWDDLRPLPAGPRLAVQFAAVGLVLLVAPTGWRILPEGPFPFGGMLLAERLMLLVAGVWFVNLTNFMDGLDGITIANLVPVLATAALLAFFGKLGNTTAVLAAATAGALLGFLAFNWHPARCFLGDVGSLPLGLIAAAVLFDAAAHGAVAAAIILPLYPAADATFTLLGRWRRGERLFDAHRHHAYQKAADAGLPAMRITAEVAALNLLLAGLALVTVKWPVAAVVLPALVVAALLTAGLFMRFRSLQKPAS